MEKPAFHNAARVKRADPCAGIGPICARLLSGSQILCAPY
jgi:hypothetical protein